MEQKLIDYKTVKNYLLAVSTYIHHQNIKLTKLKEMFKFDEEALDQEILKEQTDNLKSLMEKQYFPNVKISDEVLKCLKDIMKKNES